MNRKFCLIILLFSCLINADNPVVATKSSSDELPVKIRVIEGRRIVSETAEGKDIEAKLTQVRNKLDKEIKAIDQELEKDVADWQGKARLKVDAEYLEKKQSEIMRKKKERDVKAEAAQEEFSKAFNRELAKFNSKIKDTVSEIAEQEGWDIVKIKETGELIYTSKRIDSTDTVIRKHDNKYKAKKAEESKAKQAVTVNQKVG